MLDPKFIRENPDIVRKSLKNRGDKVELIDQFLELHLESLKVINRCIGARCLCILFQDRNSVLETLNVLREIGQFVVLRLFLDRITHLFYYGRRKRFVIKSIFQWK